MIQFSNTITDLLISSNRQNLSNNMPLSEQKGKHISFCIIYNSTPSRCLFFCTLQTNLTSKRESEKKTTPHTTYYSIIKRNSKHNRKLFWRSVFCRVFAIQNATSLQCEEPIKGMFIRSISMLCVHPHKNILTITYGGSIKMIHYLIIWIFSRCYLVRW